MIRGCGRRTIVGRTASWTVRVGAVLLLFHLGGVQAQGRSRTPVRLPDIPGYVTLATDLHTHTVFSDGSVWPDIRAEEAWREGLHAVAITDHIEYQPHRDDLPTNHDRPYEIAQPRGRSLDVLVVRGSEITRRMPPGHLNAIFLESNARLETDRWQDAVAEARSQGAFIFWNHPGWTGQQPDGVAKWYPEHDELIEQDRLHGIEVVNTREYYPEAHRWCLEKGLAILANSDVHNPSNLDYHVRDGDHRPLTLVFARERSAEALREALFARRTVAYSGDRLIGDAAFLKPLFDRSIRIERSEIDLRPRERALVQIRNDSEVDFQLRRRGAGPEGLSIPENLVLEAGHTVLLRVRAPGEVPVGEVRLAYTVENLLIAPDRGLDVDLALRIRAER